MLLVYHNIVFILIVSSKFTNLKEFVPWQIVFDKLLETIVLLQLELSTVRSKGLPHCKIGFLRLMEVQLH